MEARKLDMPWAAFVRGDCLNEVRRKKISFEAEELTTSSAARVLMG